MNALDLQTTQGSTGALVTHVQAPFTVLQANAKLGRGETQRRTMTTLRRAGARMLILGSDEMQTGELTSPTSSLLGVSILNGF